MTISPEQLLSNLRWRYATKKFDSIRKISDDAWQSIESSLILTPSSFGLQPWKFLVVKNPAIRAELLPESWNQNQVVDASHFVVLTARADLDSSDINAWMECLAAAQNCTLESLAPYRGMVEGTAKALSIQDRAQWNARQVYIALGQLMTAAAMLGIDSCPMEGINFAKYDEILHLSGSGYTSVVACALGYRAADDRYATMPKARFDASRVIQYI